MGRPAGDSRFEPSPALARKLRQSSDDDGHAHLFTIGPTPPETLPSTSLIPDYWFDKRLPTLSIAIDQYDLRHRTHGLRPHRMNRGREWERPGYLSYFDDGQLRFASGVGVRIHGGKSRRLRKNSFRVYFRDIYGADQFTPGVLFDGAGTPLRRLIVHNDYREDYRERIWHFANPLAFDITRRIGGLAPQTQPVSLFLNGRLAGVYVLTERLDRHYLIAHFGHDRFIFVRTKWDRGGRDLRVG